MRGFASNFGLAISLVAGISGIFLITRAKSGNTVRKLSSNIHGCCSNIDEDFEAEIIGDYIAHGVGGSVFRLPSGDVLKIVSLDNDSVGEIIIFVFD